MPIVKLSNGCEFSATAGEALVDAALSAGITLPHSCKTGRCSTCKCKVLLGETTALQAETGLTDAEKTEGWILSCVRSAQTDVTLEVEDLGNVVLPPSKTLPCRISSIDRLAADVVRVLLRLPPTADFRSIATIYCLPSTYRAEAFGVVLIEAMSYGLPIVASDIPGSGVPWVNQHGVSGLNVAIGDAKALAEACNQILESEDLRSTLSKGARQRFLAEFTEDVSVKRMISVYDNLLTG